jgi:hypothetical protein
MQTWITSLLGVIAGRFPIADEKHVFIRGIFSRRRVSVKGIRALFGLLAYRRLAQVGGRWLRDEGWGSRSVRRPTSNIHRESGGSVKRAGGKKYYGSPANKGDFVINTGYTPSYHRGVARKTQSARVRPSRRSGGWSGMDKCG